jgi:hypothetical protein
LNNENNAQDANNIQVLNQPYCRCSEWITRTDLYGVAVTFVCPVHGQTTIDRRVAAVPLKFDWPLPVPNNPYSPPYTGPTGNERGSSAAMRGQSFGRLYERRARSVLSRLRRRGHPQHANR